MIALALTRWAFEPDGVVTSREALWNDLHGRYGPMISLAPTGRAALELILRQLKLRERDEIWITTTLGWADRFVSPCVTATIARHCRFSSQPGPRTAAVLVIHDFGVAYPGIFALRERCQRQGWPLIEDAAHGLFSETSEREPLGTLGDFALLSLPKMLPMRRGGVVVGLSDIPLDREVERELLDCWHLRGFIVERRLSNWHVIDRVVRRLGLSSALPLLTGAVPSMYLLATSRQFSTVAALRQRGIESGPAYAGGVVFVPCHPGVDAHWHREIAEGLAAGVDSAGEVSREGKSKRVVKFEVG